ncbi:MAG TPA: MATE family efflux transporter, partial [Saprospiraceae bacterium]|nr:MATE family efflux transporter [Saprospiraceae bacterium]
MLGSAAQNVIALVDSTFLYHYDEASFAAMGFIGVFYLVIAAMGFSISRGGQIWIARKMGEGSVLEVGRLFQTVFVVEGMVALLLFGVVKLFGPWMIRLFIDDPHLAELCNDYLQPRSYGIFFSYFGVALIALYTGIARTTFILVSTVILFS